MLPQFKCDICQMHDSHGYGGCRQCIDVTVGSQYESTYFVGQALLTRIEIVSGHM